MAVLQVIGPSRFLLSLYKLASEVLLIRHSFLAQSLWARLKRHNRQRQRYEF